MTDLAWLPAPGTLVRVGHRGAAAEAPANTLKSYRRAVELGCHMVEVDVHRTADGHLLLAHDRELRGPNGPLEIATSPASVLRAVDVGGEPPPFLSEAIEALEGRTGILIDLKGAGFEAAILDALRDARMERAMLCGGNLASLLRARRLEPSIGLSWTLDPREPMRSDADLPDVPTPWVTVNHRKLGEAAVDAFHRRGVRVLAWTVDSPARVAELIAWGVDGVTSNDPAMVRSVAEAQGR